MPINGKKKKKKKKTNKKKKQQQQQQQKKKNKKQKLRNLLIQNKVSFAAESWCIASETQGLPNLFKLLS